MKINCILDEMVYCCTNYCIFYSTGSADTASGIGSDCDSASAFFVSATDSVPVAVAAILLIFSYTFSISNEWNQ